MPLRRKGARCAMSDKHTGNFDCIRVREASEGGYDARALGHSIFTQGDDWEDLKVMAREAVLCHFGEEHAPRVIRHHLVRN